MSNIARFFVVSTLLFIGVFSASSFVGADEENPLLTATVIATNIVCPNEANLPNYGFGGPDITSTTASDFLSLHTNCYGSAGWKFQFDTTGAPNPGDNYLGEVPSPWQTTGTTNGNGESTFTIPADGVSTIHIREVMQEGYIGFTHGEYPDNTLGYTAELYCGSDVIDYDNYDSLTPVSGTTHYCVVWNAPKRIYPAFCGDKIVNQEWELCDGSDGCTAQCQTETQMCTEDIFARVVVTNTENVGDGDAMDVMYVGGVAQPDWAWFPVKRLGSIIVDPSISSYQDVPGLAVERSLSGIRVRLFGGHADESQEGSEGYVEFSQGTSIDTVIGESDENAIEGTDSIFLDENLSHYIFRVTNDSDGAITTYTAPLCVNTNNSGNGSHGGGTPPKCANGQDDDSDGKADYPQDPGCESSLDNDEVDGPTSGGGHGMATSTGEVLGVATDEPTLPPSCSAHLNDYMKYGKKNNLEEVKKLQIFLNETMDEHLPVTGYFGVLTRDLVKKFQKKYHTEILKPWIDAGWKGKDLENGTGYVYKTTKRWINMMKCESLNIPVPNLRAS